MKRILPRLVAFLVLMALLGIRIADPPILQEARWTTFDTYQRFKPRVYEPELPVRIIDIDDESITRFGQWPWPRTLVAELVLRLAQMGAASIAFDIVFSEPDRSSPEEVLPMWPATPEVEALRQSADKLPSHDAIFAEVIAQTPVVTSFVLTHGGENWPAEVKGTFATAGDDPRPFVIDFSGVTSSLPPLQAAASGNGAFNSTPELDQVIRRVPLVLRKGETLYPTMSAEALRVAMGAKTYIIKSSGASGVTAFGEQTGVDSIKIGPQVVKTDANGRLWLYYSESSPERYIPAWELFEPDFDPQRIAGRIILIGTSAPGLVDLRETPFYTALPGVEVHAQAIEQILTGETLLRPAFATVVELLYMLVLGLMLVFLLPRIGAIGGILLGGAATAVVFSGSWYAFVTYGWMLDPVAPSLMVLFVFVAATVLSYLFSEVERRQVREAFSRYLSPVVVNRLADNPDKLQLGGELRTMTVMFGDIRGFTTISERYKDDPQGLTQLINRFLTPMTDAVLANNGTIDKYIGDCLMAFWNAPLDDENHAVNACNAALANLAALEALNEELAAESDQSGNGSGFQSKDSLEDEEEPERGASIEWLSREASDGNPKAQYELGKAYRDGRGIDKDQETAARWFLAAAEQDYAKAQRHLGTFFARGDGIAQDTVAAIMWLTLASHHGLVTAETTLQTILRAATPEERLEGEKKARNWTPKSKEEKLLHLDMGIGVSTGPCVVGNLGSIQRFDYSVLGDPVNLASRLEGQTKNYGVGVVIGEQTQRLAPNFAALELDLIAVKGKREAIRIFGLLGNEEFAQSQAFKTLSHAHAEMLETYRAQEWQAARDMMEECTKLDSSLERLYDLYRDRIGYFEQYPPGRNWDGVYVALTK